MLGCDMICNLYTLPRSYELPDGIRIKRVFAGDMPEVLGFVRDTFYEGWVSEAQKAIFASKCFVATKGGDVVGFACFDSTALGYFGPIGVDQSVRGMGVGRALLLETLYTMRAVGYGHAVIGWVGDAKPFYEKTVGAVMIPGADPDHTVYSHRVATE